MEKQLTREPRIGFANVWAGVAVFGLIFLGFGVLFAVQGNWVSVASCAVIVGGATALVLWFRPTARRLQPAAPASATPTREARRFTFWELAGHTGMAGLYVGCLVWSAVTADSMGAMISAACALVALADLASKLKRSGSVNRNDVIAALM